MLQAPHDEYAGPRGLGIRMTEPLMPGLTTQYGPAEDAMLDAYHLFDKAHLVMLGEEQLIPRQDAAAMLAALRDMEAEGISTVRNQVGGGMHSGEQYLIRRLGYDIGGRIHLGRSTGDFGAVARRLRERTRLLELIEGIAALRAAVLALAEQHLETVMPGQTGSQPAQPVTLAHQLLHWSATLDRHAQRAAQAYARVNQSPAGAAILTGSSFAMNRHRTAELMGFDAPITNTFDAIQGHDDELDTIEVAVSLNISLARWANDLTFWSTAEAGYVRIPDAFCGTSSIMAQKRNPAILPAIRNAASEALGAYATTASAFITTTGEFGGDGGDSLHRSFDSAIRGMGWLTRLLPALQVNTDRMLEAAGSHWAQATDLAAALVTELGLPWRIGHQLAAITVRLAEERNIHPLDVTTELVDEAAVTYMDRPVGLTPEALAAALDPAHFIAARTLLGGPAPSEAARQLAEHRTQLAGTSRDLQARTTTLEAASTTLEAAIDALIANPEG
jgi:argininosuccinate lyase